MEVLEYPKRPKFFAYRITRMMFKTALANEIGPEACHLIIQIAHTEDATRYSKPVTFYNEQLLPVCGFANVKSLDRARAKAVKSGWLVYIPGGKSKAGKYWTVIPEKHIHLDDSAIDESNSATELTPDKEDATYLPVAGNETPDIRQINGRQTPDKRQINARETPDKRATITSIPKPIPNPEYKENKQSGDSENQSTEIDYAAPRGFCINPQVTSIAIGKQVVEYHEDALQWEAEFIRRWNLLQGVNRRTRNDLDMTLRKALENRLCDPQWDWKQAFGMFPLPSDLSWTPNLTWFLKPDSVSKILDGSFQRVVRHATEKAKPAAVENFTFDEKDLED
jgi:hypothetical protein